MLKILLRNLIRNNSDMNEIELKIAEIQGRVALDNDMKIPDDIQRLARATRYLAIQLEKNARDVDVSQDIMEYTVVILDNTIAKAVSKDARAVCETVRTDTVTAIRADR